MVSFEAPNADLLQARLSDEFKVIVGDGDRIEKKTYTVHKEILVKSSDFFKKACNKKREEGKTKTISLFEADPMTFNVYLQLLYIDQVIITDSAFIPARGDDSATALMELDHAHSTLFETYLLAEMLLDIESKNAIDNYYIYYATVSQRLPPFRSLLVDFAAFKAHPDCFRDHCAGYSKEFLAEVGSRLMVATRDVERWRCPLDWPKCKYHEHDEAHPKCEQRIATHRSERRYGVTVVGRGHWETLC